MEHFSLREQVIEVVNKLFIYTDDREWSKLQKEVFTEQVQFDMTSLGGGPMKTMAAQEICDTWQKGFEGLDAINHLAGNYLVTINELTAEVFAYATATHYKKSAKKGNTRTFVGSYNLHLVYTETGWRIDVFKYNLKYVDGNVELV